MIKSIFFLTGLLFCTNIAALDLFNMPDKKRTIGKEKVELKIVGGTAVHRLEGCEEQGFHLAAEETGKGIYTFTTYCGPAPEGTTTYTVIRDKGI